MPTRAIQIDVLLALTAISITSVTDHATVPKITMGKVCLTTRAYFVSIMSSLVDFEHVFQRRSATLLQA